MSEAAPVPWTVEQAGKPSPLDEGVYDATHNHVNLYQHLDLIVSVVNSHTPLVEAVEALLAWGKRADAGSIPWREVEAQARKALKAVKEAIA